MHSHTFHALGHGFPWTMPRDAWSAANAREMATQGYSAGAIIDKLTTYGIGFFAAQAIVREVLP